MFDLTNLLPAAFLLGCAAIALTTMGFVQLLKRIVTQIQGKIAIVVSIAIGSGLTLLTILPLSHPCWADITKIFWLNDLIACGVVSGMANGLFKVFQGKT